MIWLSLFLNLCMVTLCFSLLGSYTYLFFTQRERLVQCFVGANSFSVLLVVLFTLILLTTGVLAAARVISDLSLLINQMI